MILRIFTLLLLFASCNVGVNSEAPAPVALCWNVSADTYKGQKKVLRSVFGSAGSGKLHALLGPSGSGKTTLLNALAGVVPKKTLNLSGQIHRKTSSKPLFVQQDDLLFAQLTTEETLDTAVSLKSDDCDKSTRDANVDTMILALGLKKVRTTRVGDAKTRGISGGEKKRLAVGNELIGVKSGEKALIFVDEATSGLDSFQAQRVVQLLQHLAHKEGHTIVMSIHQPKPSIFAMFDEITLISEGLVLYTGPADNMVPYFTSIGYPCEKNMNPAEFYIDLASIDYSSPDEEERTRLRILLLAKSFDEKYNGEYRVASKKFDEEGQDKQNGVSTENVNVGLMTNVLRRIKRTGRQFVVLFRRAWRQVVRDKALNIARLSSSLFSALLFGAIYFRMGNSASTVADRLGLLQVAAVNTAMTSLIKATTSFVIEKLIVQRERRGGGVSGESYAVFPYFLSKLLAEIPLSAVFPCVAGYLMYQLCGLNPAPGGLPAFLGVLTIESIVCRLPVFLGVLTIESIAASSLGLAVGSIAPSVESAVAIAPAVMVIFIVFGGLYVVNTPSYLSWVPKCSLIRWAYEALCVNEFRGLKLEPKTATGPLSVNEGEQVLESMGYKASTVKHAIFAQVGIILANYAFTYLSLVLQRPSFDQVQPSTQNSSIKEASKDANEEVVPAKVIAQVHAESLTEGSEAENSNVDLNSPSKGFSQSKAPLKIPPYF